LFLVSNATNSVIVADENTLTRIATIPVRASPFSIGLVNDKVYVANTGSRSESSSVSVIDPDNLTKITDIALSSCGGGASHLATNPNTGRVYVALYGSGRVAVIDASSDTLVDCIATNAGAFGVAVQPASNKIFVGHRDGLDLWSIDGATATATRVLTWADGKGGGSPYYLGINPNTSKLFVTVGLPSSDTPNKLYIYTLDDAGNLNTNPDVVSIGNTGEGGYMLQSQCSGLIFIAETADNSVRILNPDLSLHSVLTAANGLGVGPFSLTENPILRRVYVGNTMSNTLSAFNACSP